MTCICSFQVPLFVILLLYWKIFQTARRRIRRRPGRLGIDKFKQVILADEGSSRATEGQASTRNTPPLPLQTPVVDERISRETTADLSTIPSTNEDLAGAETRKSETIESLIEADPEPLPADVEKDDSTAEAGETECKVDLNGGIEDPIALTRLEPSTGSAYLSPPPITVQSSSPPSPRRNQLTIPFTITAVALPRKRNKESIEAKRERKAAKTLAIITGAFVVCWLPFFVMALTLAVCSVCMLPVYVESAFLWLGYFNSTLNPIIYTLFSPEFRQAFKRILCGGRNRSRRRLK